MSTTESSSFYDKLEEMSTRELLVNINKEDHRVPDATEKCIPSIEKLVTALVEKMKVGGRLFYIGAGTSGRLGIVDASEIPPTFGLEHGRVVGIMAGGDQAIRKAVEFAEDDIHQAWKDLQSYQIKKDDFLIGIAASGRTPYVIGGLKDAQANGVLTGSIACNADAAISRYADFPIEVITGPEFVTGSTRMKARTAQKLVLNMISTTTMIKLGKVRGNKMVDMQLSNNKLVDRGVKMIIEELGVTASEAEALLKQYGSVRTVIDSKRRKP
jgi:N-acetylmuramic acid 6-phosphate etherase